MTKREKAQSLFQNNYNCSQSVFASFAPDLNLSEDTCLKIASPFGAGMGRQQLTCGAVTGALMIIGMYFDKEQNDNEQNKKETYEKTTAFFNRFREKNGSITCRELLEGLNLNNPEDIAIIKERNMFTTHCKCFVTDAIQIVEELTELDR